MNFGSILFVCRMWHTNSFTPLAKRPKTCLGLQNEIRPHSSVLCRLSPIIGFKFAQDHLAYVQWADPNRLSTRQMWKEKDNLCLFLLTNEKHLILDTCQIPYGVTIIVLHPRKNVYLVVNISIKIAYYIIVKKITCSDVFVSLITLCEYLYVHSVTWV